MTTRQKVIFWVVLTCLVFLLFQWLFGLAIPEIALPFSLGTTFFLITGLLTGRMLTLLAIRMQAIKNVGSMILIMATFVVIGFIIIAFLMNSMIEKTTLFPFALMVLFFFLVTMAASSFITMIRHQYKSNIQSARVAVAQSKSELQLLQSQLSPHFLFNTLNNLYGLSLAEPDRVPPLLLKLAELLRYSVYDVKEIFVPLQYEVDYIRNYVEFERLRLGERLNLNLDIENDFDTDDKMPPLMLIVFVENAFKHSRSTGEDKIHIDIALRKKENKILFSVTNSFSERSTPVAHPEKHSGFGLESVRRRLNLLYAGKHTLRIEKGKNRYTVQLELERL